MGPLTNAVRRLRTAGRAALWLASCLLSGATAVAADAPPTPEPPAGTLVANLEFREAPFSFMNANLEISTQDVPFPQEPALASPPKNDLFRGTMRFNTPAKSDEAAMGFLWDRAGRKLYLDLNQNRNLTDDPEGVFTAQGTGTFQTFRGVRFTRPNGLKYLADVSIYHYGGGQRGINCYAALRSFWEAKLSFAGQDWQVGLISTPLDSSDASGGYLLLRPWSRRDDAFSVYGNSRDAFPFPGKLYAKERAFRVEQETEGAAHRVRLFPEQPTLGSIKLSGESLYRVVMHGGPYLVLLDEPAATVKVPIGTYNQASAWLKSGATEAFSPQRTAPITVTAGDPATVAIGGPLTNSVTIARHANSLSLNYSLVGAGGMVYELSNQDRRNPPEFAAYQGDKKVASGKFEYG